MLKGCLWPASALCLATAAIAIVTHANAADVVTDWGARAVAIGAEKQLPNGRFTRALAIDYEIPGMGVRARRGAFLIEDGVVKTVDIEQPGKFEVSGAAACLTRI